MRLLLWLVASLFCLSLPAAAAVPVTLCDAAWLDPVHRRTVPVRIRIPAGSGKVAVVLYSHGLGGSLDAGTIWAHSWAEAGFAVVNVQHPGSDSAIFGKPGFRSALGGDQLIARAGDIQFVIGELGRRVVEGKCDLARIDTRRIGMAGHSFGAQTVQAIAGQRFPFVLEPPLSDPRVRAAIGFSPSPPLIGSPAEAFSRIRIPFLSITGTEDAVPTVYPVTALQRQEPFRMMPPGDKYLLVLNGATHEMLAGQLFPTMLNGEPPVHIRNTVIAISVAFWRAMLDGDKAALRWLQNPAELRAGLPAGDVFETRLLPPPPVTPPVPGTRNAASAQ
ncbi:alpha/beta hydrolase family protein [Sphingomonas sp. Root710]|uniref:alpha/beta hydrolase family protein n=1 Tax=Sphingomonas sp. Root710 TaxID=1736594 RepID=UPI001F4927FA|nr:dienelactone hydrolase [Sphingomonas sp. Root710]